MAIMIFLVLFGILVFALVKKDSDVDLQAVKYGDNDVLSNKSPETINSQIGFRYTSVDDKVEDTYS